uniref:Uncharacterized protein n=1 Tax=Globodera rostochiensis TaxID=31243 RepID=A0A914GVH0_GLORO
MDFVAKNLRNVKLYAGFPRLGVVLFVHFVVNRGLDNLNSDFFISNFRWFTKAKNGWLTQCIVRLPSTPFFSLISPSVLDQQQHIVRFKQHSNSIADCDGFVLRLVNSGPLATGGVIFGVEAGAACLGVFAAGRCLNKPSNSGEMHPPATTHRPSMPVAESREPMARNIANANKPRSIRLFPPQPKARIVQFPYMSVLIDRLNLLPS